MKINTILVAATIIIAGCIGQNEASAQTEDSFKRFENNLQAGVGAFVDQKGASVFSGMAMKFSYGFDIFFNKDISIMPGISYRELSDVSDNKLGTDPDWFNFLDISMLLRYHFGPQNQRFVFSIGPVYSYTLDADTYYIDADPDHELNGKDKIKPFDIGLCPSLAYEIGKHWRFGIEANFGLRNMKVEYPGLADGKQHIHSFIATIGYHF